MARSIKEIKKSMTDAFMADRTIRQRYGLSGNAAFDDTFSAVSVENILFHIVASAIYVLETIFDRFSSDVDSRLSSSVLATIPWYHRICLEFQYGDELVYDETTQQFGYAREDESRRVVKYAACRDIGGGVRLLVSGEDASGDPTALSESVLTVFREYVSRRKPAGVLVDVYSFNPDKIRMNMTVQYDAMLLRADGSLITDPSVYPVEDAVNAYLKGIVYGGTFNKTRLVDAVQAATGVTDVVLGGVSVVSDSGAATVVAGNNYTAVGGAFRPVDLKSGISYVLQI